MSRIASMAARTPLGLAALDQVVDDGRALVAAQTALWASVTAAREDAGLTWQEIADVLGVSRQAAQTRFSKSPRGRLV